MERPDPLLEMVYVAGAIVRNADKLPDYLVEPQRQVLRQLHIDEAKVCAMPARTFKQLINKKWKGKAG